MKTKLTLILLAISSITAFSQSAVISDIAQKLNDFYQFYPIEKIQLVTDKDVYKPKEIIWINMLITNANGQPTKPQSNQIIVSLYSEDGIRITNDIFQISTGFIKGDLMLPKGIKDGKYILVARTQLMSHADEAFYKLIDINQKNDQAIRLKETESPDELIPGKTERFSFVVESMGGDPLKGEKLNYTLYDKDEIILEDKLKTESDGSASINLQIPNKAYDQPLKLLISNNKDELNYSRIFPVTSEKIIICFYPEGGHLKAGIPQKIGFTANDQLGRPVSVSGEIIDDSGKLIAQVSTIIPGFGMSPVIMQKGAKYTLHLTSKLGASQKFTLPDTDDGMSLGLASFDKDYIYTNLIPPTKDSLKIYLLANKGASIFWASETAITGPSRIKIPKSEFPDGISMLSVANNQGQILASRLVYLNKRPELAIDVSTPEKVKVNEVFKFAVTTKEMTNENPIKMNMAISAACENANWPEQWDSWLMINSDLENQISGLGELLKSSNIESTMNYLLIANRFKNFDWAEVLRFKTEREQNRIQESGVSGKVVTPNGQLVPKAKISLMNSQNMQIISASTDENGEFYLPSIDAANLNNFAIKAIDPEGNENLKVEFEKSVGDQLPDQVKAFMKEHQGLEEIQFLSDFYKKNKDLFPRIKRQDKQTPREPPYKKLLESATSLLDVIKVIKPFRLDGDLILFPGSTNSFIAQDGALIVVDGQKLGTSASVLNSFNPHDVESINVSTNPVDIQRYTGLNSVGLIEIETKRGQSLMEETKPTESIYENGIRVPRDFWVKKSENNGQQSTTLFWNPAATINNNGRWEFEVTASSVIGKFQLQVNAIDQQGRIARVIKTFEVIP